MASLTNVINISTTACNTNLKIKYPLNWSRKALQAHLSHCLSPREAWDFHTRQLHWIRHEARSQKLEELASTVASSLVLGTGTARYLRRWADGRIELSNGTTDRLMVIHVFDHLITAFKAFGTLSSDPDMETRYFKDMVLTYLRKVYDMIVILGELYFSPGTDGYFTYFTEVLQTNDLRNFKFDRVEDYGRIRDPTLNGVIADEAAVPGCYLPAYSTPPAAATIQGHMAQGY
jgi:hypothetical protein